MSSFLAGDPAAAAGSRSRDSGSTRSLENRRSCRPRRERREGELRARPLDEPTLGRPRGRARRDRDRDRDELAAGQGQGARTPWKAAEAELLAREAVAIGEGTEFLNGQGARSPISRRCSCSADTRRCGRRARDGDRSLRAEGQPGIRAARAGATRRAPRSCLE
jgi:hypothetical protein